MHGTAQPDVPDITPRELAGLLGSGECFVLLDVREPVERDLCAIPVHPAVIDVYVPVNQIPGQVRSLTSLCKGRTIVVYCHHGVRSRHVADWLSGQGLCGLHNLAGGIDAWATDIDPLLPRY
jgi:rhodanese-related sulfurtransferase